MQRWLLINYTSTQVSYGGYKLGANSANILVQDRITGMINEERMSVYVRLGIRLLYKGLKSREMEKKRGRHRFPMHILTRISRFSTQAASSLLRSRYPFSSFPPILPSRP
jgi:phosphatidylserine decarboxylase